MRIDFHEEVENDLNMLREVDFAASERFLQIYKKMKMGYSFGKLLDYHDDDLRNCITIYFDDPEFKGIERFRIVCLIQSLKQDAFGVYQWLEIVFLVAGKRENDAVYIDAGKRIRHYERCGELVLPLEYISKIEDFVYSKKYRFDKDYFEK